MADNQCSEILPQAETPRITGFIEVHDGVRRVGPLGSNPKFESARLVDGLLSRRVKRQRAEDDAMACEANAIGLPEPRDAVMRKGIEGPERTNEDAQHRQETESR